LKQGERWRTYNDLTEPEKRILSTELILHLAKFNVPEWKIKELIGEVYSFPNENPKSPVSDAKEYSTLINACGRHGQANIAVEVCLGDRSENYMLAMSLMQEHRRQLREGIEWVSANGVQEEEFYYFFDAQGAIKESLVGIIAGMLYGSGIIGNNKPIIALAQGEDGALKISGRATKDLLQKGLNLGHAFREICATLGEGNEGGGHAIAAGLKLQKERKEEFFKKLSEKIREQYEHKKALA
ncbi:MAG: DHHA1 domain-containing protein, partial [archaeon]|nr:DHHA1 domain-containing protein [archaeon]